MPYTFVDPIAYYVEINVTNILESLGVHFAYKRYYNNETSSYNKVCPLTVKKNAAKKVTNVGKVTLSAIKKVDNSTIKIEWKKVENVNGYEVYKSTQLNGVYQKYKEIKDGKKYMVNTL